MWKASLFIVMPLVSQSFGKLQVPGTAVLVSASSVLQVHFAKHRLEQSR